MVDGIRHIVIDVAVILAVSLMLTKVSKEVSELLLMVVVVVLASIPCPNLFIIYYLSHYLAIHYLQQKGHWTKVLTTTDL